MSIHNASSLFRTQIETPLGAMIAVANHDALLCLQFADKPDLEKEMNALVKITASSMSDKKSAPLVSIENELQAYFKGELHQFSTPFIFHGTDFQKLAWQALCNIPFGVTRSYAQQASEIGKPTAHRAVANANGKNHFVILVPCHRIIGSDGGMGGFSCGLHRKEWLLQHEKHSKM